MKRILLRCRLLAATLIPLTAVLVALSPTAAPASPRAAQASPIRHVVVIYLENHSFDNLLGYWCDDIAAGTIVRAMGCPEGGMPTKVDESNGATVTPGVAPDIVPDINHRTIDQANAIDSGRMDGWWKIGGCHPTQGYACISGYTPAQEPNLTALATRFAISDATFSMQDSPSWFGHLYAIAASTDGFTGHNPPITGHAGWGCDSGKRTTWAATPGGTTHKVPSCVPDPALTFKGAPLPNGGASGPTPVPYVPTILDRLNTAGLSWKLYGSECASETVAPNGLETCTASTTTTTGYGWAICPSFAECLYSQAAGMAKTAQFATDAKAGKLPAFSVVTPAPVDSEHNKFSMTQGDNWLGAQIAAVENGRDWTSTAVFITYDDCGCFYDQVPPGTNPDGTPQGPRIPLIIVSPYARPGYTDDTATTFAGILAYTEHTFGLAPLGVNDAQAYDFSHAFNYSQLPSKRVPVVHRPLPASARHIRVTPALANDPS